MTKEQIETIKMGLHDESNSHYGLRNIYQRLSTACKHGFTFDIESWPGIGTKVSLTLKRKDMEKDV